jgi:hypothetical protein
LLLGKVVFKVAKFGVLVFQIHHLKSLKTTLAARAYAIPSKQPPYVPFYIDYQSIATPTTMPPKSTKKRTRSSNVSVNLPKRLRISATPPPTPEPSQAWERQQLKSQPQDSIRVPIEGSHAGAESVATTEAAGDDYINNSGDDFDGLDWD